MGEYSKTEHMQQAPRTRNETQPAPQTSPYAAIQWLHLKGNYYTDFLQHWLIAPIFVL